MSTAGRRRWALRLRADEERNEPGPAIRVVVEVPPDGTGTVFLAVDGTRVALHPEDVSRVRRVLQVAQLQAFYDRGWPGW